MITRGLKLLLLSLLLLTTGCGTVKGWFSKEKDEVGKPAPLVAFQSETVIKQRWSNSVGNGQGKLYNRLQPLLMNGTLYAVANNGEIQAIDPATGRRLWRNKLRAEITGGVGGYGDELYLGARDGYVLILSAESGEELRRFPVKGEILSAPQSDGRTLVVQSYNGHLYGMDLQTGRSRWFYDSNMPVLTLRGTSTPVISGDMVMAGFSNGRVQGFDLNSGAVRWEARVAIAQGRSEIERIVDVDGTLLLVSNVVYAVSHQGNLVAIDLQSGRRLWQQPTSSIVGLAQGFGNVYVSADNGTVQAFYRNGQGLRWEQEAFANRRLSAPATVRGFVAVGDFEGYLHILSQTDGSIVGRQRPDKNGIRAEMLVHDNLLIVYGNGGKLVAYDIQARSAAR